MIPASKTRSPVSGMFNAPPAKTARLDVAGRGGMAAAKLPDIAKLEALIEEIDELRTWAEMRTRPASKREGD